ncbi:three-Cys-motif partner protein TcmP [Mucilaginibacter sp. KACC 22773]|uniref:three-Cys-motif partner protein TcmP n=1 Tax=Mucilaginibacter sp. KACC 22773 TaxID=3025671 RepID=UPI002366B78D|nr:three-Cys-motif partner protein TcmP [Mucilaginibacter sp. KACC 22773]WDF79878.1 three-Cys-motif partner protein TcmP [Mucilaginibacter sp. KACC 22773]
MPGKDLFRKPFDEGTLAKLNVFRDYLKEWLPVFVSKKEPIWTTIQIFDFFAGQGKDMNNISGSPLIALEIVQSLEKFIKERNVQVILHFNELDNDNYTFLEEALKGIEGQFIIKKYKEDFSTLFLSLYDSMKTSANFLFLDQNGIKQITKDIFNKIISLKQTDFLFYISSSYFKRFATTPEFQKYFSFDVAEVQQINYYHIHRNVLQHYKSLIHQNKRYYLAPFSIKKGSNIYGLIFGTNHTLGIEKFLTIAWKNDKLRGEANYDIDSEHIDLKTPSLFEQYNKPSKRQIFEKNLTESIISKQLEFKHSVYLYTLNEGFLFKDANAVLNRLKSNNKIKFDFELITSNLHKDEINKKIIVL